MQESASFPSCTPSCAARRHGCSAASAATIPLQPTALVHETYLRLIEQRAADWKNRAQFFAVAATAMRRILVDHARRHGARKRGGSWDRISFDETRRAWPGPPDVEILALEEALEELAVLDPARVRMVELRFFAGLSLEETAACSGSPNPRSRATGASPAPGSSGGWAGRPGDDRRSLDARERAVRGGPRPGRTDARRLPGPAVRGRR
jgi:RNA polymerase sigma factor (TIGR02999 family)